MNYRLPAILLLLLLMAWTPGVAQEDETARELLDAIREDLVELRFEKALAGIEALLGEPGMSEAERAEALVLRAQAHVAIGDLDGAEEDYREILRMRPAYEPDTTLTPNKAMVRFDKVRDELVGRLRVTLAPSDAALSVDGRQTVPTGEGVVSLLAGEHQLRAARAGYDPVQQTVLVEAGVEGNVEIRLLPNSRTVVLRTEPEGVRVLLDGVEVGVTARPQEDGIAGGSAAELVIENLALGEHLYQLQKECYREEWLKDVLTVDLLETAPKVYQTISMAPASATLALSGGPAGSELFVDGAAVGRLPSEPVVVCPGARSVEVRYGGRAIWRDVLVLREAAESNAPVSSRPNAAVVGSSDWPAPFSAFTEEFSTGPGLELPSGIDISKPAGWAELELPENTDLALGVVRATREGAADHWYLYSPILRAVHRLDAIPLEGGPPSWTALSWGLSLVDSEIGGAAVVVGVGEGSGAAAAGIAVGDRVTGVGGRSVSGASEVRAALAARSSGPVEIGWLDSAGQAHEGLISGTVTPLLMAGAAGEERAIILAAWAPVDALCDSERAPAALANLALLFSAYGHHELAADTWRRVHWGERAGVGEGTKQYYLAIELEMIGSEQKAMEAYRRAAASEATTFHDEGPAVGPAAEDRLADLGVASSAP
jgi:tetratricopeptide (TPR) repeat protein